MNTINRWGNLPLESKVRALFENTDWKQKPVGEIETWPENLFTSLSLILYSPVPMSMYIGRDFIQIFNDSYYDLIGESVAEQAFANTPQEISEEKDHSFFSLLRKVMNGEAINIPDGSLGRTRGNNDQLYNFSFSPIRNLDGEISGVLKIATKNSTKGIEERKEYLSFHEGKGDLGTWNYNPATNRFFANNTLKCWFGLDPDEEIDLHIAINAIIPEDKEMVIAAIQTALKVESGGNYNIKYTIANPFSGQRRKVHAKGKVWYTDDMSSKRLNGTLEDISLSSSDLKKSV